jgi:3-keto-5-aminohexanoate cleavage enzyme
MAKQQNEKFIILVAPTGSEIPRKGGPYVPISPEEIAEDVLECYQAGASIAHIHAKDEKTKLVSPEIKLYNEIFGRIKK